ncbi:MAG: hypothetical protein KBG09_07105 [Syntrophobacterales bacterium]|nr:hypothetical protein [Syntrophobacterales bacterium]
MKRLLVPVVALMLFFATSMPAAAQTSLEAVKALMKLEGRIETGLNFKEYSLSLADAKVETTLFLESREAKQRPELADQVRKILDHYDTARQIWKLKVTKIEDFGTAFGHLISLQKGEEGDLGRLLLKKYPQANKPADKGGALTMGAYGSRGANEILVDHMISIIWKEASQDLKEAIRMVVK